jgi:hypothetical protein
VLIVLDFSALLCEVSGLPLEIYVLQPLKWRDVRRRRQSEKAEALTNSLEAQLQPVDDPSDPAVTEMINEAMRAYEYATASETKLTSPSEVLQAIRGLKVGKAPGPNGIQNRVLRHLPKRAIILPTKVFNAVLRRQYFPPA